MNLYGAPDRFSHVWIRAGYETKTCLKPTQVEGASHRSPYQSSLSAKEGDIVGDLIDKCIREKLLIKLQYRI